VKRGRYSVLVGWCEVRTEFVLGGPIGPWWPTPPAAATLCPTFCWLADLELEGALDVCVAVHAISSRGEFAPYERADVERAASEVLRAVHEILVPFEGTQLIEHWRRDVPRAQTYAKKALLAYMTVREMKQLQIELSDGKPLAVCVGKRDRESRFAKIDPDRPDIRIAVTRSHGDGCGVVHPDSMRAEARIYCDPCKNAEANRQRAHEAAVRAREAGGGPVFDSAGRRVWKGTCPCCNREFTNARPDAERCEECRQLGRRFRAPSSQLGPAVNEAQDSRGLGARPSDADLPLMPQAS
jgi:hypothetical protein